MGPRCASPSRVYQSHFRWRHGAYCADIIKVVGRLANKKRIRSESCMSPYESLAPRTSISLETIQNFLGTLSRAFARRGSHSRTTDSSPRSQVSAHTSLGDKCLI